MQARLLQARASTQSQVDWAAPRTLSASSSVALPLSSRSVTASRTPCSSASMPRDCMSTAAAGSSTCYHRYIKCHVYESVIFPRSTPCDTQQALMRRFKLGLSPCNSPDSCVGTHAQDSRYDPCAGSAACRHHRKGSGCQDGTAHRAVELSCSRSEGGGRLQLRLAPQHERHARLHDARLGGRNFRQPAAERSLFKPDAQCP